jgi:tetraacyldisaccharide 4'-kinase
MLDKLRKNRAIQLLLLPLSWPYCLIIKIRNFLYDLEWFKVHRFPLPVVSIGNLLSGGSGKTPLTMLLIEKFSTKYKSIVVISRGYGRSSSGTLVVSDGKGKIENANTGGDEPVMIANKFLNIPVIVSEQRAAGIELALKQFDPQIILLDDAFQHRSVYRDVNIVLLDINRNPCHEKMIPAGDRREPIKSINRADVIIYTKSSRKNTEADPFGFSKWFSGNSYLSEYVPIRFRNVITSEYLSLKDLVHKSAVAFSGIASPEYFEQSIRKLEIQLCDVFVFSDHYAYQQNDFEMIKSKSLQHNCKIIITTDKDAVKIDKDYFSGFDLLVLEMDVIIENDKNLVQIIENFIDLKMKSD